jgi:hypothetical protein
MDTSYIIIIIGALIMLVALISYSAFMNKSGNKKNSINLLYIGIFITGLGSIIKLFSSDESTPLDTFSVAQYEDEPLTKCPPSYRPDDYIDPTLAGRVKPPDMWEAPFNDLYFIKKGNKYYKKKYTPLKESFPLCPIDYRLQDTDTCIRDLPNGKIDKVPSRGCRPALIKKHGFSKEVCGNAICGDNGNLVGNTCVNEYKKSYVPFNNSECNYGGKLVGKMCVKDVIDRVPAKACRPRTAFPHRFSADLCMNECQTGYEWNGKIKKCSVVCPAGSKDFGTYCKSKTPVRGGARTDIN